MRIELHVIDRNFKYSEILLLGSYNWNFLADIDQEDERNAEMIRVF